FDGESKVAAKPGDKHSSVANDETLEDIEDYFIYRFKKPENAPNTDMRPPHGAMDGYYGNTVRMNAGKSGNVSGTRERRHFYHPDGAYQEFGADGTGNNPMQSGLWYWDAAGHNCMLHQYPSNQRQQVVCHDTVPFKKPGDSWVERNGEAPFLAFQG